LDSAAASARRQSPFRACCTPPRRQPAARYGSRLRRCGTMTASDVREENELRLSTGAHTAASGSLELSCRHRRAHSRTRVARAARAANYYDTRAGAESAARCALRATKSERARLGWPGHRSAPRPRQLQLRRPARSAAPLPPRWRIFRDDGALCARAERAPVRGSRALALCRRPSRRARCPALAETSRTPLGCRVARAGPDGVRRRRVPAKKSICA
jgi:hypothetical protein